MTLDLHRHDEFSSFDGFGKALDLARLAKKKGLTALGIANHGNMNGVVEHWKACLQEGIKPVLGVEAYFQPKFNKKDPKRDSFHMCLFAENLQGYKNLNRIMTYANMKQRYYKPIVDFDLLEKYSEGVIATSGCIASFISQAIKKGRMDVASKAIKRFVQIFGRENFYIELQPYKLDERSPDEKNLQENVNVALVKLAKKHKLKMILTSDSHYGSEDDYDTYVKMHDIKGSGEFNDTYAERYMPNENDLVERFIEMHENDFDDVREIAELAMQGLQDIEDKVEMDILGQLELELPKVSDDSKYMLIKKVQRGLKKLGKWKPEYKKRAKYECDVITHLGYEDYFLIVADYCEFADKQGIKRGPGRGSVCNSLVAYALGITTVDSLYFDIPFERFMRKDKKKMPDIDLDFETDRRQEVIDYVVSKYPGKAAQICSYGMYKVDNLVNDLAKVSGLDDSDKSEDLNRLSKEMIKGEKKRIKDWLRKRITEDEEFHYDEHKNDPECRYFNKTYDNIILHFSKMFKKVRFIGTHAAGVGIVGGNLLDYTCVELRGNKTSGYMKTTAYNLNNLEEINVIKFDMLGLRTLSITKELEEMTDECFSYEWLEDPEVYEYFAEGKTDGIFQFEKDTAKGILMNMQADSINDVIAASALNRPGPLSLKMPDHYAYGKLNGDYGSEPWAEYTNKTFGTIVYQEQIQRICIEIGQLSYEEADKVVKFMKSTNMTAAQIKEREKEFSGIRDKFVKGAMKTKGLSKEEANDLFMKITVYTFNEGHSTGYSLISFEQMYYKRYHPEAFWLVTLKYANSQDLYRLKSKAVLDGNVILLPHVNYGSKFTLVQVDGENALAEGLSDVKGVGPKAAEAIENERLANGRYRSKEDFLNRVDRRVVNAGVLKILEANGALLFDKKTYFSRVQKYNSTLYMKAMQK